MAKDAVDHVAAAWAVELPGVVGLELELGKRAARLSAMLAQPVEAELVRLGLTRAEYEVLTVLPAAGPPWATRGRAGPTPKTPVGRRSRAPADP